MDEEELRNAIETALAPLAYRAIDVTVSDSTVYLNGVVRSARERADAIAAVRSVRGVSQVVSNLTIGEVTDMNLERAGEPFIETSLEGISEDSKVEPDFHENLGTTDVMESGSENEPFFPPTDPVVHPIRREDGDIVVIGGFAPTSDDNVTDASGHPPHVYHSDDELAGDVLRALARDAGTADLDIRVFVRNGVAVLRGRVQSMEDAEQAEAVAASVPGIVEVREELEY